jgi:hypothetical protein
MTRSPLSRLFAIALTATVALFAGMVEVGASLYRMAGAWMLDKVHRMPAPMASPHEPTSTAHQRTWLIAPNAHQATMTIKRAPAIEPGWRMCPST